MKKLKIEYWGKYLELQACAAYDEETGEVLDEEEGYIDSMGAQFLMDELRFKINGKEYDASDFENQICPADEEDAKSSDLPWVYAEGEVSERYAKDIDVEEEADDQSADYVLMLTNKDGGEIEIDIPDDEEFNPTKVMIYINEWILPEEDLDMASAFVYDGKGYEFVSDGGCGSESETVWGENPNE